MGSGEKKREEGGARENNREKLKRRIYKIVLHIEEIL